jgi:hypothetical protein
MVWAAIPWLVPLVPFMVKLLQGSKWTRLGNQVYSMIQTLFPNNNAVFQDNNVSIHTAGTVQPWFKEHESELQLFPGQHSHQISTSLNQSGQFWRLE